MASEDGPPTNQLVALGSCGFVVFGVLLDRGDPTRIAAQVVTGIGFLGAGIILRDGINVHGLNTAATLWCSAMVGIFAGGGMFVASVIATGFIIAANLFLRPLARGLNLRILTAPNAETQYRVEITTRGSEEAHVRSVLLHALSRGDWVCVVSIARTFLIHRKFQS